MAITIWGIVQEGRVVPSSPLPEGARVEIRLLDDSTDTPPELQAELADWQRASAEALEMVERLAQASESDEKRC